jgi:hypothetical protein
MVALNCCSLLHCTGKTYPWEPPQTPAYAATATPLLGLSPVGDVVSVVENVSSAYSDTTLAPHEHIDQTGQRELFDGSPAPCGDIIRRCSAAVVGASVTARRVFRAWS